MIITVYFVRRRLFIIVYCQGTTGENAELKKALDGALRPGKLNSQFIVTTFPVLHVGGWSLFRFQIQLSSRVYRKPQTTNCKKTTDHRAVPEQAGGSL